MPNKAKHNLKLTQAQSVIIAAIITSTIGGIFLVESVTRPIKLQVQATQTSEAKTAIAPTIHSRSTQQYQTEVALATTQTAVMSFENMRPSSGTTKITIYCQRQIVFSVYEGPNKIVEISCPPDSSRNGTQTIYLPNGSYEYQYQLTTSSYATACPISQCSVRCSPWHPCTKELIVGDEPVTLYLN